MSIRTRGLISRQHDVPPIYDGRHPDNGHPVSGAEFEAAAFYELFRTDLHFHDAVRHLERKVHETLNSVCFACHDAFEHPFLASTAPRQKPSWRCTTQIQSRMALHAQI